MSVPAGVSRIMRVPEFLTWDDGSDTRYELVDGRALALATASAPHALLRTQLAVALHDRLPKACGSFVGCGLRHADDDLSYRVPDLVVGAVQSRARWIERPRLVVEILSPSTQKLDLTGKLAFYRALASIEEILLLRCDARWCELWQRVGRHWSIENHAGTASLPLRIAAGPIPLDELYLPLEL